MRKNRLLCILCAGLLCSSAGALVAGQTALAENTTQTTASLTAELFAPSSIRTDAMQTDAELTYLDRAMQLTSTNTEDSISWHEAISGDFTFDYLPTKENAAFTARRLEVTFTDVSSEESFTLVINHGETLSAYVKFNGVSAGIYYSSKNTAVGLTEISNTVGSYTNFTAEKIRVRFVADETSLYIGSAEGNEFLVWDLQEAINDGYDVGETLNPFTKYSVSWNISSFMGDYASILMYEINGCPLESMLLEKSGVPTIFANFEKDALAGEKYTLPQGYAYDVLDGNLSSTATVYDPSGAAIDNITSFTPTLAGEYKVRYRAVNSLGTVGEKEYALTVYDSIPTYDYELDWTINGEVALNEKLFIPEIRLFNGLRRYGDERGRVSIEKDGVSLRVYQNVLSGFNFTFNKSGEYVFTYSLGGEELTYTVLVNASDTQFVTTALKTVYEKNSILDCSSFYVLVGGEKVAFDFTVEYPSGKRYLNKKFELKESGTYTLTATASVDGKAYSFEKQFDVGISNEDFFTSLSSSVTISEGKSPFTGRSGVVATTKSSGAVVEYTTPIDLSKYVNQTEKNDKGCVVLSETAKPIIEFSVDPAGVEEYSAAGIYVILTDANDPENKLTIYAQRVDSKTWTYIKAGGTGQTLAGFYNSGTEVTLNGASGTLTGRGFMVYHAFSGMTTDNYVSSDSKIALYYDNEKKQLLSIPRNSNSNHIIMDFDDPDYCGGVTWSGFSSNQIFLSFMSMGLAASESSTVIYSIDGKELSADSSTLTAAPTIQLASDDTLVGLKGYSLAIPSTSATDCYGNSLDQIVTKVYYEKNGESFDVSIANGRFNTKHSGVYYIVYTATDMFGRTAEKRVRVDVAETMTAFTALLEDVPETYKGGKIGDEIMLYGVENVTVEGGIGETITTSKIYLDNEEIAFKGDYFKPQKAGTYTVEYTFTDAVGRTATVSYEVEVTAPQEPVITSAIPHFVGFVRGNVYEIPEIRFVDYTKAEATEQKAEVYINGAPFTATQYVADKKVEGKDETEQIETVRLEYRYGEKVLIGYDIPVKTVYKQAEKQIGALKIDIEKYLFERYFVSDEAFNVSAGANHLVLKTSQTGAETRFAQQIATSDLSFGLDVNGDKNKDLTPLDTNLKAFTVRIIDAADRSKSLYIELFTDEATNKVRMRVNGTVSQQPFTGSLVGTVTQQIKFRYSVEEQSFYDQHNGGRILKVLSYENGEEFNGFGNSVYVSFGLQSIDETKETSVRLYDLNGQNFSNDAEDDMRAPSITVNGVYGARFEVGEEIQIHTASAIDMLSSVSTFTVSVTRQENGRTVYVKDVNGVELNGVSPTQVYTVKFDAIGDYSVVYQAKDSRKGEAEISYGLVVTKRVAPVITLNGELPQTAKKDEEFVIPTYDVTYLQESEDNLSWVVLIAPDYTYSLIKGTTFTPTQVGTYIIRYCALDIYGATTVLEYTIECKG